MVVPSKYGIASQVWQAAREEIRQLLVEQAKKELPIAYSELTMRLTSIHLEPDSHALAAILGEISEKEKDAGRGMLSVLVIHKDGDMMPGAGFFEFAARFGRDVSDRTACWIAEFKLVISSWKRAK